MKMLWYALVVAWCCLIKAQATQESPRIIIVGAGVSGVSAAARLMQNGFNNITILEAENRIGGRVDTRELGPYLVDMGAQWVHGEEGNEAFELAWPLGLIERSHPNETSKFFGSSGPTIPEETLNNVFALYLSLQNAIPQEYANRSTGDFYELKLNEYFGAHPEIISGQRSSLMYMIFLIDMAGNAADSWFNISAAPDYVNCKGDLMINWKDKGYSTILDILTKKIPNPAEELPVVNSTVLGTEVTQINYNGTGSEVRVVTANGDEYVADHVIVTVSIGVLKADHEKMFNPGLPEQKLNAMKGAGLGSVVKVYLLYEEPWWLENNTVNTYNTYLHIYWTEEDRTEIARDPERAWLLGMSYLSPVAHKPNLLMCWFTGHRAREMESIPNERVFSEVTKGLRRFFGKSYNVTEPIAMIWKNWYTNKHFRGTWSHRTPEFHRPGVKATDLADPIVKDGKPIVQFAGEATHPTHFSTVQGAIGAGWREADRLTKLYGRETSTPAANQR